MKRCCLIGHRDIKLSRNELKRLYEIIKYLIKNFNVEEFYIGNENIFDKICINAILDVKTDYPYIKIVYIRAKNQYPSKDYIESILEWFDDTIYPERVSNSGKFCYIERNKYMIDNCDYCIFNIKENREFFIGKNYITGEIIKTHSGTYLAYNYAIKQGKKIININDKI